MAMGLSIRGILCACGNAADPRSVSSNLMLMKQRVIIIILVIVNIDKSNKTFKFFIDIEDLLGV